MEKLMKEYPNDYQKRIERLSEYMASTGRIYKNHLATIRSWAKWDEEKARQAKQYDHGNYQFAAGESL
jgi:ribosomal protein S18